MKIRNMVIVALLLVGLCGCGSSNRVKGIEMQGNYYEDLAPTQNNSPSKEEEPSKLSEEYLTSVAYEVSQIDEENMTITMEVQVPQIEDTLTEIIDSVVDASPDTAYEKLRQQIEDELIEALESGTVAITTQSITLPIEKDGRKYEIIYTDEWTELLYGDLVAAYAKAFSQIGESEP